MRWRRWIRERRADGRRLTDFCGCASDLEAPSVADGLTRLLGETLASPPWTFAIVSSIVNPDVYVQWSKHEGGLVVEIADPGRHRGSPLTSTQCLAVEALEFVPGEHNFERHFTEDRDVAQIGEILASALDDVFGISHAHDLQVDGPNQGGGGSGGLADDVVR
jgi:hypothetical protein